MGKIVITNYPTKPISIFDFAEIFGLKFNCESHFDGNSNRVTAHFEHAEIQIGYILSSPYGDSSDSDINGLSAVNAALRSYARRIEGKTLVINAMTNERKEIQVPNELRVPLLRSGKDWHEV